MNALHGMDGNWKEVFKWGGSKKKFLRLFSSDSALRPPTSNLQPVANPLQIFTLYGKVTVILP